MTDKLSILVTGGGGYLGSVLVAHLLAAGHRVTALDTFAHRQNSLAHCCCNPDFDIISGDARDERIVGEALVRSDVVVPLAAVVGAPACDRDPIAARTLNRDAVEMLVRRMGSDQRLLMPVTNSGYGIGESDRHCTEDTPLRPISLYGRTKVEAEAVALDSGRAISFRLATVFGMSPRMRVDLLVNDFVYRALHDRAVLLFESHFKRNYVHVQDVARVFLHGIEHFETMKGRPYNVGLSDANLSKWQLCERIRDQLPRFVFVEAPIGEDPDKRDYIVSNARIESTGFLPQFSLEDGIRELIVGYRMLRNTAYGNV